MLNANLLQMISQFKNNPMQMLASKYNIPQGINNPQDIINNGKLDNKNQKYFLRNNKKFNNNIKELLKDLSDSNSDNESSMLEEESEFSISSFKSNNDYQSDKLLETFISNSCPFPSDFMTIPTTFILEPTFILVISLSGSMA